jgi:hypothetical protein
MAYGGITSWRCVVSFTLLPLCRWGNSPPLRPGIRWLGGSGSPIATLDNMKRTSVAISRLELSPLGSPAPSQSLTACAFPAPRTRFVSTVILVCNSTARLLNGHMRFRAVNLPLPPPAFLPTLTVKLMLQSPTNGTHKW